MKCVNCSSEAASKVLYMGFPMKFCPDCEVLWGFWSYIPIWFGFNGVLFPYSGFYLVALWNFLFHSDE